MGRHGWTLLLVATVVLAVLPEHTAAFKKEYNVTASAGLTVSNSVLGCKGNADNITVAWHEDGGREYVLLKFLLKDMVEPNPAPEQVLLTLFTVEGEKSGELSGALDVQVVENSWDSASTTCNNLPAAVATYPVRKMSGVPYAGSTFELDLTETVSRLLADQVHTLSLLIKPPESEDEVFVAFGSTIDHFATLGLSPALFVRAKDVALKEPSLLTPSVVAVGAGEQSEFEIQIPHDLMKAGAQGELELPPGSLGIVATHVESGTAIQTSISDEGSNDVMMFSRFHVRMFPKLAGRVHILVNFQNKPVSGSPFDITVVPAAVDPAHCSSDFGTPDFMKKNPLPRVGSQTCFTVFTRDMYDNLVGTKSALHIEALAGVEEKTCNVTLDTLSPGKYRACIDPADADALSVSIKIGDPEEELVMIPNFPVEVDCLPGPIVPAKTEIEDKNPKHATAGIPATIQITTFDQSGHVSNPNITTTTIEWSGPAEVKSQISLVGAAIPQSGISLVNFTASKAGFYEMFVNVDGARIGPFNITVFPDEPKAAKAVVSKGNKPIISGKQTAFTITSFDTLGNPTVVGGLDLEVEIVPMFKLTAPQAGAGIESEVTDTNDGSYTVLWVAERAGLYQVTVFEKPEHKDQAPAIVEGCPFNVTVLPGALSLTKSGFAKAPEATLRAGQDPEFIIQERDQFGNARTEHDSEYVISATVTSDTTNEVTALTVNNNGDGTHRLLAHLHVAGPFKIVVRANDTAIAEADILVVAGPSSPYASAIASDPTEQHIVNKEVKFEVRMRDAYGNEVATGGDTQTLKAEAVHPGIPPLPCKVVDHFDGHYTLTFKPSVVGVYTVFVQLKGASLGESPLTFKIAPGEAFGPYTYAAGASLHAGVAGELQHIVVRTRDIGKNDVVVGGAALLGFVERHPDARSESDSNYQVTFTDNNDGTYSGVYNATEAGDYSMFVRLSAKDILASPFALLISPNSMGKQSILDTSPLVESPPQAGNFVSLVIHSYDDFGNERRVGGDEVSVQFKHTKSETVYKGVITDLQNGTYIADVKLIKAGDYVISAGIDGRTTFARATGGMGFTVVPSKGSPDHSTLSGEGVRSAVAGVETKLTLKLRDMYYNDAIVGGANVSATLVPVTKTSGSASAGVEVEIDDNSDGTYELMFTANIATEYSLKVYLDWNNHMEPVQGTPTVVVVTPNIAAAQHCKLVGNQTKVVAGQSIHFVLHTRDAFGNVRKRGGDSVIMRLTENTNASATSELRDENNGLYYIKFSPRKAGVYKVIGFVNGGRLPTAESSVTVLPAATDALYSEVEWSDLDGELEAGVPATFRLLPADIYGNPTTGEDGTWTVFVTSLGETTFGNISHAHGSIVPTRASATAAVTVKHNNKQVVGSPHTVLVRGSWTNAGKSSAFGPGLSDGVAGHTASFVVRPLDQFGNPSTKGPVNIEVLDVEGFPLAIRNQELDTEYNISYIPMSVGEHTIRVMVQETHLPGSPFRAFIKPGPTSALRSVMVGGGLRTMLENTTAQFVVYAKDALGNPRLEGGDTLSCIGASPSRPGFSIDSFKYNDRHDGEYIVTYRAPMVSELTPKNLSSSSFAVTCFFSKRMITGRNFTVSVLSTALKDSVISFTCPNECSGNGVCDTASGLCLCGPGWRGADCAQPFVSCPHNCSFRGSCNALTGSCFCYGGYTGDACEVDPSGTPEYVPEVQDTTGFDVKQPSVVPPKCHLDCSGNGKCIADNKCDCELGFVGSGCETRTFYSLLPLDHGFVLAYEMATGRLYGLQQGVADDKTCSGLTLFATTSNIYRPAQRKHVHIGNNEVLEIDPLTSKVTLLTFDFATLANGTLIRPKEHPIGKVGLFQSRELTYLGMNRLLVSSDNSSTVYQISRRGDEVLLSSLHAHNWDRKALRGHYFYAGHDMIGRFAPNGTFALFSFARDSGLIREPHEISSIVADVDPLAAHSTLVVPLSGDMWFAFDYKRGSYAVHYCPVVPGAEFGGCSLLNSGSLFKGYRCARQPEAKCSEMSRVACVQSKSCGYCLASKTCMRGDEHGPGAGSTCASETGASAWVFTTNEFGRVFVPLGAKIVVDFEAASGKYSAWGVDRDTKSPSCRALVDTVATGYLQNTVDHELISIDSDLIDFDPATGKFRIATCNYNQILSAKTLQCDTWADGWWPALRSRRIAIVQSGIGKQTLLLDYNANNGDYRVWSLASKAEFENGVPLMQSAPVALGSIPALVDADVFVLPALSGMVLAHQSITSTTAFLEVVGGKLVELAPAVSKGIQTVVVDGQKKLLQTKFIGLGNNTMLQYGPLGFWKYFECYSYPVPNDVFNVYAPVHCEPRSAGSPNPPMCSARISESTCTANPNCGWCASTRKCYSGYRGGVCSKTENTCPSAAWVFVGGEEKGGFVGGLHEASAEPSAPVIDCSHSSSCGSCVADSKCGWHKPSSKCVPGSAHGPTDTDKYPVANKGADWSFYYCTGVDGCDHLQTCEECAKVTYCGFCASSKRCSVGTGAGPIFEGCSGSYYFDRSKCAATH